MDYSKQKTEFPCLQWSYEKVESVDWNQIPREIIPKSILEISKSYYNTCPSFEGYSEIRLFRSFYSPKYQQYILKYKAIGVDGISIVYIFKQDKMIKAFLESDWS